MRVSSWLLLAAAVGVAVVAVMGGCGEEKTPSPNGKWSFSVNKPHSRTDVPLIRIYNRWGKLYAAVNAIEGATDKVQWLNDQCLVFGSSQGAGESLRLFGHEWVKGRWKSLKIANGFTAHLIFSYELMHRYGTYSTLGLIIERGGVACDMATLAYGSFEFGYGTTVFDGVVDDHQPIVKQDDDGLITISSSRGQKWLVVTVYEETGKIIIKDYNGGRLFPIAGVRGGAVKDGAWPQSRPAADAVNCVPPQQTPAVQSFPIQLCELRELGVRFFAPFVAQSGQKEKARTEPRPPESTPG